MSLLIGPETKIGALLEAYPGLEDALIGLAPAFGKLRNPMIRRTVAKIATLEQAAQIGGVDLRQMIRALREAAGQPVMDELTVAPANTTEENAPPPAGRVSQEIDAGPMLASGVHPIGKVREALANLPPGEWVLLRSSFRPQPLIDTMRQAGADVRCCSEGALHLTYFGRR